MANRFEQPIASEFINTYVPIPFKEMLMAGQMKQQRYDAGAAAQDAAIQNVESLEAVPGSPDELFKKEQLRRMYDIRDKYVDKDLSDSFVLRQMNNDINTNINKERIKDMTTNVQNWKTYEKQKVKLADEGKYNPLLDKHDVSKYDSSKGVHTYTLSAYSPKEETLDRYFDEIRDPSYKSTIQDPNNINYGMQNYSTDDSDVARVIGARANEYASTVSGQQEIQIRKDQMKAQGIDISEISDTSIAKDIMTEVGQRYKRNELRGTRAPQTLRGGGGSDGNGAIDSEFFSSLAAKSITGQPTDRKALAAVDKENTANQQALIATNAELKALTDKGVPTTDVRYKSALQVKEKLTNDISKYEESNAEVDKNTEIAMQQQVVDLKNQMTPLIAATLGMDPNNPEDAESIQSLLDEHLNANFGKGMREFGHTAGSTVTKGLTKTAALLPGIAGMIINGVHRNLNRFGVISEKDKNNFMDSLDKAIEKTGITENSSFAERTYAGWKVLNEFKKSSRIGWGKSINDALEDKNYLAKMHDFDKQINKLENNRDQVRQAEKAKIFNYNVSDMMVKPLNYTTKSGRTSIITEDGIEYDSQINDFTGLLKQNPAGYDITDVSEGNKLTKGSAKFNAEVQSVMVNYDPLPGMIIPKVDKDGNVKVRLSYQTNDKTGKSPAIKTFEVKVKDESTINAFAQDLKAAGYTQSYLRLINRKLHSEVETFANSSKEHDYSIMVPTKDGKGVDKAYITGKRIGSEYVAIDPDTNDVLVEAIGTGADKTTKEVRFNTKEEFENWLYAKQHFLLTGKN